MGAEAVRAGESLSIKTLTTALIQAMGNSRHRYNKIGEYWVARFNAECRVLGKLDL